MGQSRNENILENILGASNPLGEPQSREEALLMQLLESFKKATYTEVSGTLTAGQTSITLLSDAITADSTVLIFTSDGTQWTSVTVSAGQVVIAFDSQSGDIGVKAWIYT